MLNLDNKRRREIEEQIRDSHVLVLGSTRLHIFFYDGDTLGILKKEGHIRDYEVTLDASEALTKVLKHNPKEGNLVVVVHDSFRAGEPCNVRKWVVQEALAAGGVFPIHFDGQLLPDRTKGEIYIVENGVPKVLTSSEIMEPCPRHIHQNILPLAYITQ